MNAVVAPTLAAVPFSLTHLRCGLGECVLWDAPAARLLWTDIEGRCLYAWTPASGELKCWPMPVRLACFALGRESGRLLLGLERALASFDLETATLTELCQLPIPAGLRVNDGRCDRAGNFVFGLKNERDRIPRESFWRYTAAGDLQSLALPPVVITNSLCFSRDGSRIHFADSLDSRMRCADYDAEHGSVSAVRPFGPHFGAGVEPDGAVVDADDGVWCALWGGSRVVRIDAHGRLSAEYVLPVSQAACPGFGGAALERLYVATARAFLPPDALRRESLAGAMLELRVPGLRGLAETRFGGAL
jgi:L-arabinonolactonase